jgi:hypothetical protein
MPIVDIEGIGQIDLPDDTTPAEINQIVKNYSEAKSAVSPEGIGDYATRQAGLTARAAINPITAGAATGAAIGSIAPGIGTAAGAGAGAVAGLVTDIIPKVYNALIAEPTQTGKIPSLTEVMDRIKDEMGLPRPATDIEKMSGRAIEATSGLMAPVGAGRIAMQAVSPIVRGIGQTLTSEPAAQALSTMTGAIGQSLAESAGAGPAEQTAAGLVGALVPSAAALRFAPIPGTSVKAPVPIMAERAAQTVGRMGAPREQIAQNIEAFQRAGTMPSAGQATESGVMRGIESTLGRVPGSIDIMRAKSISQQAEIGGKVKQIADELSAIQEPVIVGQRIQKGIKEVFEPIVRAREANLYNKLDKYIPGTNPVSPQNTYNALKQMIKPIEGAAELSQSQLLSSPELQALTAALEKDMAPMQGRVPFSALKGLRTKIGEKLGSVSLGANVTQGQYKRIYAALSDDLRNAAEESGPQAIASLKRANQFSRTMHERFDKLQAFIDKNEPEKVFNAAFQGAESGPSRVYALMRSIQKEDQKAVVSAFVSKMGRALPGAQDAGGDIFSTERFLTNWNKLSPGAKQELFGRFGSKFGSDMNKIAKTAELIREGSRVLANPSGTAGAVVGPATYASVAGSIAAGKYGFATGILSVGLLSNIGSRLFTNPTYVNWLAKNIDAAPNAVPGAIANLIALSEDTNDKDLADIAKKLKDEEISRRLGK